MSTKEASRRFRAKNLEFCRKRDREAYHRNPNYKNHHWAKHGVKAADGSPFTTVVYDREYQIQQGCCKICGKHQSAINKSLVVEHSHITGFFRGLVCQGCNIKVGAVESKEFRHVLSYLNLEVH